MTLKQRRRRKNAKVRTYIDGQQQRRTWKLKGVNNV